MAVPARLNYSVFYYDAALAALDAAIEEFAPWHTETDEYDPINVFKRITAYRMHRDAALADRIAEDLFWPTFRTRSAAVALAALVGYRLKLHTPARVDVVAALSRHLAAPETIVPAGTRFATQGSDDSPAVSFELADALTANETSFAGDLNTGAGGGEVFIDAGAGVFRDFPNGESSKLWFNEAPGDKVYFGHPDLMFTKLVIALAAPVSVVGTWEYFDSMFTFAPGPDGGGANAAVVDAGGGVLRLRIDGYSGALDISDGTFSVEVLCLGTGEVEECIVQWDAGNARNYVETTSYLGQSVPSTSPTSYEIRPRWVRPAGLTDGTDAGTGPFEQSGDVTFDLPQTRSTLSERARRWSKTTINGVEAFWLRARRCGAAAAGSSTLTSADGPADPEETWWVLLELTQGETVNEVLGLSDGTKRQRFALGSISVIEDSALPTVDGESWDEVENFYRAGPNDKVWRLVEDPDGTLYVVFNDGVNGKIPPDTTEIAATYRIGADLDGNVGSDTVTVVENALTVLTEINNPRPADGWTEREGSTPDDIERLRVWVPGWARVGEKVVTPEDAVYHALYLFKTDDARAPIGRADFAESVSDDMVLTGWVLGPNGDTVSSDDLDAAHLYFNGRTYGYQREGGVMLANQRADLRNATLRSIDVDVTVWVLEGHDGGVEADVRAAVRAYLKPTARKADGTFAHRIAGKVSPRIVSGIAAAVVDSGLSDLEVTFPAEPVPSDPVDLQTGELPTPGTINVTVNVVTSD